jgi:hypothetical protein
MTTRSIVLKELIARDRSHDDAALFEQCHVSDVDAVATIGAEILDHTPVFHGACASMSAAWAALLSDRLELPAVAVAGDLMIGGFTIFLCDRNLPDATPGSPMQMWDGHCWIEIDGWIGDISVFRTARTINRPSRLKSFVESNFGLEKGLMLARCEQLETNGMHYVPKYVLNDMQINALLAGLRHQVQQGAPQGRR